MTKQNLHFREVKSEQDLMDFIRTNKDTGLYLLNLPGWMSQLILFILFQNNFKH